MQFITENEQKNGIQFTSRLNTLEYDVQGVSNWMYFRKGNFCLF